MPLRINDKRLIPAPLVTIGKSLQFTNDGRPLSTIFNITLRGTLLPNRGSPMSFGWHESDDDPPAETFITDDEKFDSLLSKQELLRELLSAPGFDFTYYSEGYDRVSCKPQLIDINFEPGIWVIRTDYTIQLQSPSLDKGRTELQEDDLLLGASGLNLRSVNDDWTIREREEDKGSYEVTRRVSAVASVIYTSGNFSYPSGYEPWRNAKTWVDYRLATVTGLDVNHFDLDLSGGTLYNLIEENETNKLEGSYSVSQRYIWNNQNYIERRNIQRVIEKSQLEDTGPIVERITINGTIEGLDPNNDPSGKLSNANDYWDILRPSLSTIVNANGEFISESIDRNEYRGTLDYNVQFVNNSGTNYTHVYDVSYVVQDGGNYFVSINGQIEGVTDDSLPSGRFNQAATGWSIIEPNVRSLAFAETSKIFGGVSQTGFTDFAINRQVGYNKSQGTINYNYTFGNKTDGSTNKYVDEYSIELSTTNPMSVGLAGLKINANINGNVRGIASGANLSERFNNALDGWSTIQTSLFNRVNTYISQIGGEAPGLRSSPLNKSVSLNKVAGIVNYSASFNNDESPPTGVAEMSWSIDEQWPQDIFAIQLIPGRSIGPILQNINTKSENRRNINISLTMYPKNGGYWSYGDVTVPRNLSSGLISSGIQDLGDHAGRGVYFYVAGDSEGWDWRNGLYTRNINIVYTPTG